MLIFIYMNNSAVKMDFWRASFKINHKNNSCAYIYEKNTHNAQVFIVQNASYVMLMMLVMLQMLSTPKRY